MLPFSIYLLIHNHNHNINDTILIRVCPCGVMVNAVDCGIVVNGFELQSRYYVNFRANTLGEKYKPPYPPSYGLDNTTSVLGEWLWH